MNNLLENHFFLFCFFSPMYDYFFLFPFILSILFLCFSLKFFFYF
ncbi:hypothetical protein HMPREF1370_00970 [Enterococcus faecium P1123]|uniref:Uncharacterized protein n=1 Tax=Enterococcus faecium R496 TaxID=1134836 RepID=A0AAV3GSW0_ENTFC|nr:hypothetical protein HMPREF9524_00528 [Enterococcus faecium TX0133a01]EFR71828.1 hypothetical protein HMPREF9526_01173 [Enterococcus faecium TX0133B]EFR78347.1 hypothetical protein HMPREF9527_00867 [Enterococcus faecium TX0133C]EFS10445.1 hypothetical protein HMPREF9522_00185 [Enterococcus faecium TX0082]EJX44472.1 hypothetical protein HMPREF1381_00897 [Enterococcus faecium R501]EJX44822.1 hypothetical protein HMPREF1382_00558 [Enterococcus faecium S447]EJX48992.1 hypothetical protein HMPR